MNKWVNEDDEGELMSFNFKGHRHASKKKIGVKLLETYV